MSQAHERVPAYCTILAQNYLPKAVALAQSLSHHHPGTELVAMLIDVRRDEDLPEVPGIRLVSTEALGLREEEVLHLATIYGLVEFATAVKPQFLSMLLKENEQAAYLDPDTYVTAPMVELPRDLAASEGGLLLTPHFLDPVGPSGVLSEGHLLNVGVYNLGFCAVDRRAQGFLDWWWSHLQTECLWDPLSGLFVDQKWVDVGAALFAGTAWRHRGYNVSVANLHERPLVRDEEGLLIDNGDRLRLFHFHAFDPHTPDQLTTRSDLPTAHLRKESEALEALCREYAERVIRNAEDLPEAPAYAYDTDTRGRPISRHLRRAYRVESAAGAELPSPYRTEDADAFDTWRRRAWRTKGRELAGDAAKSVRVAFPEEYGRIKERFPQLSSRLRGRVLRASGFWR